MVAGEGCALSTKTTHANATSAGALFLINGPNSQSLIAPTLPSTQTLVGVLLSYESGVLLRGR